MFLTESAMGKTMDAQSTDSDYVYAVYRSVKPSCHLYNNLYHYANLYCKF